MSRDLASLLIVTNNAHAVFQRTVIAGAKEIAGRRGYDIDVHDVAIDPASVGLITSRLSSRAGLLIVANALSDDQLRQLHSGGLPMTLVSHFVPGVPIPSVVSDNTRGIAQLVNHLVQDCGCHNIVFIQGDMGQRDGIKRDQAFRQELVRHDLPIREEYFLEGDFVPEIAARSMRQFLRTRPDFDAVLASDYLMAAEAMKVLRESGLRAPEDVCVVGFGDGPEAADAELTVVAADVIEVGRRGVRQLIGQIDGLQIQGLTILSTELAERGSTARVESGESSGWD